MTGDPERWPQSDDPQVLVAWVQRRWHRTLMAPLGIRLLELGDGRALGELPVHDGVRTPVGPVHAGAIVALADTMATGAALTAVNRPGEPERFPVAVDLSVQLVGNVDEGHLRAESQVVHRGRTLVVVQTRVTSAESGRLLALMTSTHFVPPA